MIFSYDIKRLVFQIIVILIEEWLKWLKNLILFGLSTNDSYQNKKGQKGTKIVVDVLISDP